VPTAAPEIPTLPAPRRWRRWLGWTLLILVVLGLVLTAVGYFQGYRLAKAWVQSAAGQRTASNGLGHAIKVDGTFAPLRLDGWTITTDSFGGPGWPGEALGGIQAQGIRADFDPSAIFHRAWRISGIQIDRATIQLRAPNDALKRPVPAKKPRPWYALLLPNRFECGPIVARHADLEFMFQNRSARIHDAQVQADLIGKDLKYTATSGQLEFPYLPPLAIRRLEMLVTRPLITITTAQLAAVDPADPARLTLSGKLGMRENKSIDAQVEVVQMPIEQILPENLKSLIHGRASGRLVWTRDATGGNVASEGDLTISGGRVDDLSVFRQLTLLHDNPDLKDFSFDQATCHFRLQDGVCTLELKARSPGKFDLSGKIDYRLTEKTASLDVAFANLPVQTWLPAEFKPRSTGVASAGLKWQGRLDTIRDSAGTVAIDLDGAQINMPAVLRHALAPKRLRVPDAIEFQKAELAISYRDQTFQLTRGDLVLPNILNAQLSGSLSAAAQLNASTSWQGLTIQDWLPPELADQFHADIVGRANLNVRHWKLGEGSYAGEVNLMNGELSYTSVQSLLARFTNDRRLLEIPLTRGYFYWEWDHGALRVSHIDLRGRDDLAVQGALQMDPDKKLSGTLWIGTRPVYLKALGSAADAVFVRSRDGLVWAKVTVSGTTKKPEQDLSAQVVTQLKRRPLVVLGLGFKLASWYLGNLFGAGDEWKRPADNGSQGIPSASSSP
jgi:hypothetical protein